MCPFVKTEFGTAFSLDDEEPCKRGPSRQQENEPVPRTATLSNFSKEMLIRTSRAAARDSTKFRSLFLQQRTSLSHPRIAHSTRLTPRGRRTTERVVGLRGSTDSLHTNTYGPLMYHAPEPGPPSTTSTIQPKSPMPTTISC